MTAILICDNGSTKPAATLQLRHLAEKLGEKTGHHIYPVSLQHADKIAADKLNGTPASILGDFLKEKLSLIVPFSLAFFALYLLIPLIELSVQSVLLYVVPSSDDSSIAMQLFKRMIIVHSFWFFGVHGDNAYSMMFDQLFLQQDIVPGLMAKTFYDTFVLIGGTGCFIGLIVAAFMLPNASHEKSIAKISIPFSLFNFCEIILFALPVFLNPMLLVPFILVPCFNFLISYFLIIIIIILC